AAPRVRGDPRIPRAAAQLRPERRHAVPRRQPGPEGGIAPAEVESLRAAGAIPVALGPGILRTSTAGPAALALVNAALGRW
ncbi:16S rRNA (uracil(1498)-N(3))-methyltransferase, partial [Clavibacter michiganensis]|uniref:16S rRNA (uracil(1498)-N(3))-methyltransferase n=1 Tax=Clavibacter michiganensis TaxID=28447 RepID=UPI002930331B